MSAVSANVLIESELTGVALRSRGKVRDVYEVEDALLIVATDRISAFDVVLPNGIPDKGRVLNQLSLYCFGRTARLVPNHVLTGNVLEYPPALAPFADTLAERSMLVRKLDPIPFECVVRGYLDGVGWKDYRQTGALCGVPLPAGLELAAKLAEPIFTPATKAASGHDVNVSEETMASRLGVEMTSRLKRHALDLYAVGSAEAAAAGILIADTKFEFGLHPATDELFLIDEALTPDSSRFWPLESYAPGREQPSFDKQYVREYLETLDWDKTPPGPELPAEVVDGTRERYLTAYRKLTGRADL